MAMRISDTTLVASALFQVAKKTGTTSVSPGAVTGFVSQRFGVSMPLHQVVDILQDMGVVTHTVQNNTGSHRYIVWDDDKMSKLKDSINNLDFAYSIMSLEEEFRKYENLRSDK